MYLSAFWVRFALICSVVFGMSAFAPVAFAQTQKPAQAPAQTKKQAAPQAEPDALATKPCPRGIAEEWDNCNGVSEFQNGDRYVGNFRKGLPDGIGTYTWKNGREYFGEFRKGLPHGKGKFTDLLNSVYIGDFVDGRMSGKATVDYQSGAKYVGDYRDDRKNGKGTYTYSNGDKYVGEFIDDEMTPNGELELANGDKYVGGFKSMKPQGKGTYTFKDGRKFTGEFVGGEPQGQGILAAADGNVLATGQFVGWDAVANPEQRKASDLAATQPQSSAQQDTNKVIVITPSPSAPADAAAPGPDAQAKAAEKTPQPQQQAQTPQAPAAGTAPQPKAEKPKIVASLPQDTNGDQSGFPVHCRFKNGFWYSEIQCDVVEDATEIKEIVFNRGKCPNASDGLKQLQEMRERDGGNLTLLFRSLFVKSSEFRGPRKFGDRIDIPVVNCPNLLEFTVEVNEATRTWKTY